MSPASETLIALKRPPGKFGLSECRPLPDLSTLMETASKDGEGALVVRADWARTRVAITRADTEGPATHATPTAASNSFLPKLSLPVGRCDITGDPSSVNSAKAPRCGQ